jgi:hypothetical protein
VPKALRPHRVRARYLTLASGVVLAAVLHGRGAEARAANATSFGDEPLGLAGDSVACRSVNAGRDVGVSSLTRERVGSGLHDSSPGGNGPPAVPRVSADGPVVIVRSAGSWISGSPSRAFEGPYRVGPPRLDGDASNDTTVMFVWVGSNCTASLSFTGIITPTADERDVEVAEGGSFHVVERGPTDREYAVWTLRGQRFRFLKVNNTVVHISVDDDRWFAEMVREYIRRTGADASDRSRRIVRQGGVRALFEEATKIIDGEIRATYLVAAFAGISAGRAEYVQQGADLLRDAKARTRFLSSVPLEWRAQDSVLAEVYRAAAVVDGDDCLSEILNAAEPPRPVPSSLRAPLDSLIASFHSESKRRELQARFADTPH